MHNMLGSSCLNLLLILPDGSNLVKKCIGYIDLDQNATYPFYDDCNETSLSAFPSMFYVFLAKVY